LQEARKVAPPVKRNDPQITKAPCNGLMPISVRQKLIIAREMVRPIRPLPLPRQKVYNSTNPNIKAMIKRFIRALLKKPLLL